MALILYGKPVMEAAAAELSMEIKKLGFAPILAIFQVGKRADSESYVKHKKKFAERIGAKVVHKLYPEDISEKQIIADIKECNKDDSIHGIIVQLPLPEKINKNFLIEAIDPRKDVDGLSAISTRMLYINDERGFVPATAKGIMALLANYKIDQKGKRAVVVGRSSLVGKPTALCLLNMDATVTIAHSKTPDLKKVCKDADILIVAIGKPGFIDSSYVSHGQVVVDVGITPSEAEGLVGDVNFESVEPIVKALSPVPGGVGPTTVSSLFVNLVRAAKQEKK